MSICNVKTTDAWLCSCNQFDEYILSYTLSLIKHSSWRMWWSEIGLWMDYVPLTPCSVSLYWCCKIQLIFRFSWTRIHRGTSVLIGCLTKITGKKKFYADSVQGLVGYPTQPPGGGSIPLKVTGKKMLKVCSEHPWGLVGYQHEHQVKGSY